jgi:hypothetical protein
MCVRGEHISLRIVAVMSKLRRPALLLAKRLTVNLAALISRHGAVTQSGDGDALKSAPPIFPAAKTSARFEPGLGTVNPMSKGASSVDGDPQRRYYHAPWRAHTAAISAPCTRFARSSPPRGNQLPPF